MKEEKKEEEEEDAESRTSPPRGMGLPRHSLGAGVMKSSSWGTSWLYFAGVRRRQRASCNGKILNSLATHVHTRARVQSYARHSLEDREG